MSEAGPATVRYSLASYGWLVSCGPCRWVGTRFVSRERAVADMLAKAHNDDAHPAPPARTT